MSYGLPSRGQSNWDDELNNSMEYVRGQAEAAVASANNAVSDAAYAKNKADAVAASTDSAVAESIENGTLTPAALTASIDQRASVTYYVSPTGDDADDGVTSAWATLAKVSAFTGFKPGDSVLLERGGTWNESLSLDGDHAGITVGAYGTGAKPVIDGADSHTSGWTLVSGQVYKKTIGANTSVLGQTAYGGIVIHNGLPLDWVAWDTDEATTVATMSGAGYATDGCFSHSKAGVMYVRLPGGGSPNSATVAVAQRDVGIILAAGATDVTIRNINTRGGTRHGIVGYSTSGTLVEDCTVELCGGAWSPSGSFYVGNGIEFNGSYADVKVIRPVVRDVFDSGISGQIFANNLTGTGFVIEDAIIDRCGYAGIEFSLITSYTGHHIEDVFIRRPRIRNCGNGWSPARPGRGITFDVASGTTSSMDDITIIEPDISDCAAGGINLAQKVGTVKVQGGSIRDCVGDGVRMTTLASGDTGTLNLDSLTVVGCSGSGLHHDNFYGGQLVVKDCTFRRNGGVSTYNVYSGSYNSGASADPIITRTAFIGQGSTPFHSVYGPSSANLSDNTFYRTASTGTVVHYNGTNYTTEAMFRTSIESDALFIDPIHPDLRAFSPFLFPFTVDPGIIRQSDHLTLQAANACHFLRVQHGGFVSKIGFKVGSQGGNMSVAVYRNTGRGRAAQPGTRLATSGAVTTPAVGYREVSLGATVEVRAGDWIAISSDSIVPTFASLLASGADSDLGLGRQYRQATAHPAPSSVGTLVATVGYTYSLVGVE